MNSNENRIWNSLGTSKARGNRNWNAKINAIQNDHPEITSPFVLSKVNPSTDRLTRFEKKKKRNKSSFRSHRLSSATPILSFLSFLPSGISFHRSLPEGSLSSSRRIIAVSTAHHRRPGGKQEARKASRRSPYWGRSISPPIGDRACEAWVRVAANSRGPCPTTGPPHPRVSRAHEQLQYRSNSRPRTLVPVASLVPSLRDSTLFIIIIIIIADKR